MMAGLPRVATVIHMLARWPGCSPAGPDARPLARMLAR